MRYTGISLVWYDVIKMGNNNKTVEAVNRYACKEQHLKLHFQIIDVQKAPSSLMTIYSGHVGFVSKG